jgi:general secretion pathway protein A
MPPKSDRLQTIEVQDREDAMFGQKTQPGWFFSSARHVEAMNRLVYLVECREPVAVLSGPDGSGRSRVLERVGRELRRAGDRVVSLSLSGLDSEGVLWLLVNRLSIGLLTGGVLRRHELLNRLRDELSGLAQCGTHTTLLLDDVHRAEADAGSVLRFLVSLAASGSASLSVVAVVESEIPEELGEHVYLPVRLEQFSAAESAGFATELLQRLGLETELMDAGTVRALHEVTRGLPQRLQQLCELLHTWHEAWPSADLSAETVRMVAAEAFSRTVPEAPPLRALRMA